MNLLETTTILLAIMGPVKVTLIYAKVTQGLHDSVKKEIVRKTVITAGIICLLFAFVGHDLSLNGEVDLVNKLVRADIEAGSISFDTLENLSKSDSGHSDNNAHITLDSEWAADVTLKVDQVSWRTLSYSALDIQVQTVPEGLKSIDASAVSGDGILNAHASSTDNRERISYTLELDDIDFDRLNTVLNVGNELIGGELQVDWSGQYGLATQQFESGSGSTNFTDGELVGIDLSQQVCDIANKIMTLPISQGDFSQATRLNRLTTDLELIESSMSFPIYSWTQTP